MELAPEYDVDIKGLHPCMRRPLKKADEIWKAHGRNNGVTVTAGLNGMHSAGSWHYCGCALDFRTNYFDERAETRAFDQLKAALPGYDVINHGTHIHVEPGDALAKRWGLML